MRDADGRLLRSWKDGSGKIVAFLEDEAYLVHALLELADTEEGARADAWAARAREAVDGIRRRFRRPGAPGFTFSGEGNEVLLASGRDLFDKAIPSASGAAAWAFARVAGRTGDAALAREAREAVEEVSWLMARSPHGTESWFLALEEVLGIEGKAVAAVAAAAEQPPIRVEGAIEGSSLRLRLSVTPGWHLQGPDGLRIEAWAGSDFTFEAASFPAPSRIEDATGDDLSGWQGTFEAILPYAVSPAAAKGKRDVSVVVRFRACGEGTCQPERALSLEVPVEV
jgi:hypothetical protein